jgi:hypothetical protein
LAPSHDRARDAAQALVVAAHDDLVEVDLAEQDAADDLLEANGIDLGDKKLDAALASTLVIPR